MDTGPEPASVTEAVETFLENASGPVYAVRPSVELINLLVERTTRQSTPVLHVLTHDAELKSLRKHFPRATRAADLVDREQLTLTAAAPDGWGTTVATRDTALAVSQVDEHRLAFEADAVPEGIIDACVQHRKIGERFDLRTPSWGTVTETLTETLGEAVREDVATAVEALDTLTEPTLDEVGCTLLVAARHELLLYHLTHWAEDIQLRSKAAFSRAKGDFEEIEIVESEKVPIGVGRPRLRVMLTDEYAALSVSELIHTVDAAMADCRERSQPYHLRNKHDLSV